jgi:chemotaxis protein methyltransferase CheR
MTKLAKNDFRKLGDFIQSRLGIKMPDVKRGMIESRLRKRLNQLGLESYADYCDYLFSTEGMDKELPDFIDVITTNKTDFFREPHHFAYLIETALPDLVNRQGIGVERELMAWSSACSRGDEPYTLGMVFSEYARIVRKFDFSILATDISTRMLETAVAGIYDTQIIDPVPLE